MHFELLSLMWTRSSDNCAIVTFCFILSLSLNVYYCDDKELFSKCISQAVVNLIILPSLHLSLTNSLSFISHTLQCKFFTFLKDIEVEILNDF